MKTVEALKVIDTCNECGLCLDICQTYQVTQNKAFSPMGRLQIAKSILQGDEVSSEAVDSIYSCLKCARCHMECPQGVEIAGVVRKTQAHLMRQGIGPLERPNRIIEGIQKLGNAVNGDPAKRWDWLPEEFPKRESDTLLYVGCTACFLAPQAATSSYLLLKELGVDFMMLQDEGCCGDYLLNIGAIDLAREKFQENAEKFKRLGIKKIITICAGCYHTFERWYPRLLGEKDFEVVHIAQLLPDLLAKRKESLKVNGQQMAYQDPCLLSRLEGICDEPREALRLCGVKLAEMKWSGEMAACCGARNISNFRDMALKMAGNLLDETTASTIVTSCSFCLFGLNYAARKTGRNKEIRYLSEVVLDSLNSSHPDNLLKD